MQISITLRETNFFMIGSTDFFLSKSLYYCLRITYKYGTTNNQLGWFTTISNIFRFSSIWIISFNTKLSGVFCYTFLSVKTFYHKYLTARISIILTSFWSKKELSCTIINFHIPHSAQLNWLIWIIFDLVIFFISR